MAEKEDIVETTQDTEGATGPVQSSTDDGGMKWGKKPFDDMPIPAGIKAGLSAMGYLKPTEVQDAVLDVALTGKDIIVQSHTGSGKTTAFALPTHCRIDIDLKKPQALILTPTRELANQVALETTKIGKETGSKIAAIYGGASIRHQMKALEQGAQILVGTPGRVLDLIGRGAIDTSHIKVATLDEADEMLSMGFWEDVTKILRSLPDNRQTMLFSATLPPTIELAAKSFLNEPQRIDLSSDTIKAKTVSHFVYEANQDYAHTRNFLLVLENHRPRNAVIFCNRKGDTETLSKYLKRFGFRSAALNGDMSQNARERVLKKVRAGELDFMVATDVAARGIDISDLPFVFHYDMPESNETYVHRSGRTGRIGKSGKSIALARGKYLTHIDALKKQYDIELTHLKLPSIEEMAGMQAERVTQLLSESADGVELGAYRDVAKTMLQEGDVSEVFAFLLRTYFSQQTASNAKDNRDDKTTNSRRKKDRKHADNAQDDGHVSQESSSQASADNAVKSDQNEDRATEARSEPPKPKQPHVKKIGPVNLYVTLGRDDGIDNLGELMEVMSDLSGIDDVHFTGRGRIRSSSSHIEIDHDKAAPMIAALHDQPRPSMSLLPQPADPAIAAQTTDANVEEKKTSDDATANESNSDATQVEQKASAEANLKLVCEIAKMKRRQPRRRQDNRSRRRSARNSRN